MKPARRVELAYRQAEATLNRLEALRRGGHLAPAEFLAATRPIRDYLAVLEHNVARLGPGKEDHLAGQRRVLERTRALAVSVGLEDVWDETMEAGGDSHSG